MLVQTCSFRGVQFFWSGQCGEHGKRSPRTIGSEAGYLTGSTVQSRRDGVKVYSPGRQSWVGFNKWVQSGEGRLN
jgi:hypothetical protein